MCACVGTWAEQHTWSYEQICISYVYSYRWGADGVRAGSPRGVAKLPFSSLTSFAPPFLHTPIFGNPNRQRPLLCIYWSVKTARICPPSAVAASRADGHVLRMHVTGVFQGAGRGSIWSGRVRSGAHGRWRGKSPRIMDRNGRQFCLESACPHIHCGGNCHLFRFSKCIVICPICRH